MFNLGASELFVIFLIVLLLFGGKKVSGLGKALGTSLREFKEEMNKTEQTGQDTAKPTTIDVKAETAAPAQEKTQQSKEK